MDIYKTVIFHPLTNVSLCGREAQDGAFALARVELSAPSRGQRTPACKGEHPILRRYATLVEGFLNGTVHSLDEIQIFVDGFTSFRLRVAMAARRIPWGRTVSYQELAAMAGNPSAARAAATVMRTNPFPLVVPCHRVIRADGSIGGFGGSMRGKLVELKRRLLVNEGVDIGR